MSSKVLSRDDGVHVTAIAWERIGVPVVEHPDPPAAPHVETLPACDTMELHRKLEEVEAKLAHDVAAAERHGFAQGENKGRQAAGVAQQALLDRLTQSIAGVAEMRPNLRHEAEADVVQLAIAIARRVIHRELNVDPSAIQALVQVALSQIERQETYRVRVHASQVESVRTALARLGKSAIDVIVESTCQPGTLVFETNRGQLDASVETQLEEISRGLADRVRLS